MTETAATPETITLRELLASRRTAFFALPAKYGATRGQLFGSVARGDARSDSDIDIFPAQLLKVQISRSALNETVPL